MSKLHQNWSKGLLAALLLGLLGAGTIKYYQATTYRTKFNDRILGNETLSANQPVGKVVVLPEGTVVADKPMLLGGGDELVGTGRAVSELFYTDTDYAVKMKCYQDHGYHVGGQLRNMRISAPRGNGVGFDATAFNESSDIVIENCVFNVKGIAIDLRNPRGTATYRAIIRNNIFVGAGQAIRIYGVKCVMDNNKFVNNQSNPTGPPIDILGNNSFVNNWIEGYFWKYPLVTWRGGGTLMGNHFEPYAAPPTDQFPDGEPYSQIILGHWADAPTTHPSIYLMDQPMFVQSRVNYLIKGDTHLNILSTDSGAEYVGGSPCPPEMVFNLQDYDDQRKWTKVFMNGTQILPKPSS
jgi:hypothetical protein